MDAVVWSDLLCPWCYAGLDRTIKLRAVGISVTILPFELHPELPPSGSALGTRTWARVRAACEETGRPFRPPPRVPNTRRLLEAIEVVGGEAASQLHERALTASFGEGKDLSDPDVFDELLVGVSADPDAIWTEVSDGAGRAGVDLARERAFDAGIGATPAWLLDGVYVIPGVQPWDAFTRAIDRLRARRPG